MANEKPKDDQAKKPVRIDDLSQATPESGYDADVKGGMISRGGLIGNTDEDADEIGE